MLDTYNGIRNELANLSKGLKNVTGKGWNAILYFERASGAVIIDELGNYTVETITEVGVKVRLTQKKDPNLTINPGVDAARTYMEGHLTCPVELCGAFPNYLRCELKENNLTTAGKFTFIDKIPQSLHENMSLSIALGQQICGYFERDHISL